jgi:hypothetical protein
MSTRDAAWWRSWFDSKPWPIDVVLGVSDLITDLAAAESRAEEAEAKVARLLASNERMAGWIMRAPLRYTVRDYACVECNADSEVVVAGWRCGYHEARRQQAEEVNL